MKILSKTLKLSASLACSISLFSHTSFASKPIELVDQQRLIHANSEPHNWLSHGKNYAETRFSELKEINQDSVKDLGLAWSFEFDDNRALESTPLVLEGIMYSTGAWSKVFAHDAKTGELLWKYDPKVKKSWLARACCGPVNRGVALWKESVLVGTLDGYLVSINRLTGEEQWRTLTIDPDKDYTITGAPRVIDDKVIIGNGGAEFGVRGYVSAYDTSNGELVWRFYTVPGNPADGFEDAAQEKAAKTWTGEWWKLGGGGTVWDSMSYDPKLDLLYIGVGNGSPWNQEIRSPEGGDNLYLSSIVAVRPNTGEYVWHYQTTPGETWDFTATQQMILADIEWQGETRQVIMQAPKNGFFFIIDRKTGEFLSAEPYTDVVWATGHNDNGRPIEAEGARFKNISFLQKPSAIGGHNWHSMAYSENTGYVYIPVIKSMMEYAQPENFDPKPHVQNIGVDLPNDPIIDSEFMHILKDKITRGEILAWDPQSQREVWRKQHKRTWNGGILATAGGLVFQGTADQRFIAFNDATGDTLWEFNTLLGIVAAPISYSVDGEQYIAIQAKWGGGYPLAVGIEPMKGLSKGRLLVFKLGGKAQLPPADLLPINKDAMKAPQPYTINNEEALTESISQGKKDFIVYCSGCHGNDAVSGGNVPDLRHRSSQYNLDTFKLFVLEGVLSDKGMVSFKHAIDDKRTENIYNYILQEANSEYADLQDEGLAKDLKYWFYHKLADFIVLAVDGHPIIFLPGTLAIIALLFSIRARRKKSASNK